MRDLFEVLEGLFLPRVPPPDRIPTAPGAPPRRPVYLPKVTPGQRAILDFLQEDLRSGWQLALRLLAKYSIAGWGGGGDGDAAVTDSSSGGIIMGGARAGLGVTVECVKEVAEALCSMMSTGRVPRLDRALALEALLLEVNIYDCRLIYTLMPTNVLLNWYILLVLRTRTRHDLSRNSGLASRGIRMCICLLRMPT